MRHRLRLKFWAWVRTWHFIREIVSEELTDALHPEFGWAWADDQDFGRALKERDRTIQLLRLQLERVEAENKYWLKLECDAKARSANPVMIVDVRDLPWNKK